MGNETDGTAMTTLNLYEDTAADFEDGRFLQLISSMSRTAVDEDATEDLEATNRRLRLTIQRLERLVYIDELTGLPNRRFFDSALEGEIRRAVRAEEPLSLLLCDIDRFKLHNDTFGHRGGDALLRLIGEVLQRHCRRAGDCAARYGGEEFALILPKLDSRAARVLAERLRAAVAELAVEHRDTEAVQRVTISIGVTTFRSRVACGVGELVDAADEALYTAKNTGRDRVCYQAFRPW